jgi:hypothetical protein
MDVGRTSVVARRFGTIGLAAVVVGAVLVGGAVAATAASSGTPTITVNPNTNLSVDPTAPSPVQLTGKGFPTGSPSMGGFSECSTAAGQPTVSVTGIGAMPVSCTDPFSSSDNVNKAGRLPLVGMAIIAGTVGPPGVGTDTSGGSAVTDAANYPCPPFASQVTAGATCEITYFDAAGDSASENISFTANSTPDTTTTTTQAVGACQQAVAPATESAGAGDGQGTVTVTPATCLVGGQVVNVTATGLTAGSSTNSLGTILECNPSTTQPTVEFSGNAIPVSCSPVLAATFTPNAAGTLTTTFTIIVNTTGPPVANTVDSAGVLDSTDAAKFPCDPTSCVLVVADLGGDKIIVPISFNTNVAAKNPGTTGTTTPATKAAAKTSATKAGSSSLAFTGTGPGLWWLGLIGVILMAFGGFVLVVIEGPRRRLRVAQAKVQSH